MQKTNDWLPERELKELKLKKKEVEDSKTDL